MLLVDMLPFLILVLHFTDKAFLAAGKLWAVYCLTIAGSISTITYNLLLWKSLEGNHSSILLFSINSAWTISMAATGIGRLLREAKRKEQ